MLSGGLQLLDFRLLGLAMDAWPKAKWLEFPREGQMCRRKQNASPCCVFAGDVGVGGVADAAEVEVVVVADVAVVVVVVVVAVAAGAVVFW